MRKWQWSLAPAAAVGVTAFLCDQRSSACDNSLLAHCLLSATCNQHYSQSRVPPHMIAVHLNQANCMFEGAWGDRERSWRVKLCLEFEMSVPRATSPISRSNLDRSRQRAGNTRPISWYRLVRGSVGCWRGAKNKRTYFWHHIPSSYSKHLGRLLLCMVHFVYCWCYWAERREGKRRDRQYTGTFVSTRTEHIGYSENTQ